MLTSRRFASLASAARSAVATLFVALLASSCAITDGSDDDAQSASTNEAALGTFRPQTIAANNLQDGEIVLTFDDGPAASSGAVAELLAARGHVGLFFVVSKHLGDGGQALDETGAANLDAVALHGQLIGNHTHDHCIGGASACGGRSFAALTPSEQRRQVELTDTLVRRVLARAGKPEAYLPFFRSPGNSWSAAAAASLSSAQVSARTYGPVAWNVPAPQEEDFRCWQARMSPADCAARYVRAFRDLPRGQQKAVILIHDNFAEAADLTAHVLDGLVGGHTKAGRQVHVVHPRCLVGCTR